MSQQTNGEVWDHGTVYEPEELPYPDRVQDDRWETGLRYLQLVVSRDVEPPDDDNGLPPAA